MSHHRVMVVEVMGRNAGWLALHTGVASGSDIILMPEIPYDLAKVCEVLHRAQPGRQALLHHLRVRGRQAQGRRRGGAAPD